MGRSINSVEAKGWGELIDKMIGLLMPLQRELDYKFPITAPTDEKHIAAKKALYKEPIIFTVTNLRVMKKELFETIGGG